MIHKLNVWILLFQLISYPLSAQTLSHQAEISLLTYSPSKQLYTAFGHNAIRVKDPANSMGGIPLDMVYNYGTFDFNEPGFYLKFMRGKLNYRLSAYNFRYVELEQQQRQMDVREQVFDLTLEQKQALFDFLNENLLPKNRFYLYDFFYDNCATRIRDAFEVVLDESFQLDTNFIAAENRKTFRQLVDEYMAPQPWGDFGIDLALGSQIDQPVSPYHYMFLPDYLAKSFDGSTLTRNGQQIPLVKQNAIIMTGRQTADTSLPTTKPQTDVPRWATPRWATPRWATPRWATPRWTFIGLFALFLGWTILTRNQKTVHWPDILLFGAIGLLGSLLLVLWLATDHQTTKENWNLLWAHPLHLLTAILFTRKQLGIGVKLYFLISGFFYLGLIAGSEVIPQEYHPAVIPLIALIAFRYFYKYHQGE
ncbi:lipoprotein N-acyltransferase Lnb domain-containing protein [Tunicatimonas pelagia]|uniref:lipoprotein N-acyltransferase Lnb domain-containing protein n=1 Tax=Tunicatimonas pelagia TaxID=931531 RepID=UPI002664EC6E|nr:DUF4105 domain-containing protein [Tunicatimonas pelagia]WKN40649.1 DUF4105 domain-containing protein [Tunicatimonas pelagia]